MSDSPSTSDIEVTPSEIPHSQISNSEVEVKDLSLPSHAIIRCRDSSLARVESSVPAPSNSAPQSPGVDYLPLDNHRALLKRWQTLHPLQQFTLGGLFGLVLGLSAVARLGNAGQVLPFAPATVNHGPTLRLSQFAFHGIYHRIGTLIPSAEGASFWVPTSEVRPFLHPIMVDRFYIPTAAGPDQTEASPLAMVVDRFYFSTQGVDAQGANAHSADPRGVDPQGVDANGNPLIAVAHQVGGGPQAMGHGHPTEWPRLRVPLPPPPHLQPLIGSQSAPPPNPTPSLPIASAPSAPVTPPPLPAAKVNRLIGVVRTGQFSAALVQTEHNAYAVRLGDRLSQSAWQLIEVQDNFVILADSNERITLHVGDMF